MSKVDEPQPPTNSKSPVALVTGSGSKRVGRAIAEQLAVLGYDLAIHANTSVEQANQLVDRLREQGTGAVVVQGDLSDEDDLRRVFSSTLDALQQIDVLVNSAAIWFPTPLEEVNAKLLRSYFDVNSTAIFLLSQMAGLHMAERPEGGCIINISDWALCRPYLNHAAYFPSKGAVEAISRSLAVELAHRNPNVRVNCIAPGPVLLAEDVPESTQQALRDATLVKRLGTPEHIAHAVRFLVENDFVTGSCIPVDGGRSIYAAEPLQTEYGTG